MCVVCAASDAMFCGHVLLLPHQCTLAVCGWVGQVGCLILTRALVIIQESFLLLSLPLLTPNSHTHQAPDYIQITAAEVRIALDANPDSCCALCACPVQL